MAEVIERNYRSCSMASYNRHRHEQTPITYIHLCRMPSDHPIESTMSTVQATLLLAALYPLLIPCWLVLIPLLR